MQMIPQSHRQSPDGMLLAEVLARPDIWRGDALAKAPKPGVSTGFAALDAELPGGGWPRGAVVELMVRHGGIGGIGEMALLMPVLAVVAAKSARWIVCVAPPMLPFAPGWSGVPIQRLMVVQARGDDAVWACARALDTEGVGALLAWLPDSRAPTLHRLQLLAERSEALVFVFRPCVCAAQSSPAPLRLMLEAIDGGGGAGVSQSTALRLQSGSAVQSRHSTSAPTDTTLAVHLLKRRGAGRVAPVYLKLSRPGRESYWLPRERVPLQANSDVVAESVISAIPA